MLRTEEALLRLVMLNLAIRTSLVAWRRLSLVIIVQLLMYNEMKAMAPPM